MKRFIVITAAISLVACVAFANGDATADSDGVIGGNLTVDIGTAHVFRGITIVDDLVIQPSLELSGFGMPEKYGIFTVGVWGSIAPFNDDPVSYDTMYETDWYVNYELPKLAEDLDLFIQYTIYQYAPVAATANEKEINLGAGYALGDFYIGGTANFMVDDRPGTLTKNQKYFDLFADYEIEINEKSEVTLGALISLLIQGDGNGGPPLYLDDGFNHYELEAAYSYELGEIWSLGASLAYIGQLDSNVLTDTDYDKGVVAFFSVGADM